MILWFSVSGPTKTYRKELNKDKNPSAWLLFRNQRLPMKKAESMTWLLKWYHCHRLEALLFLRLFHLRRQKVRWKSNDHCNTTLHWRWWRKSVIFWLTRCTRWFRWRQWTVSLSKWPKECTNGYIQTRFQISSLLSFFSKLPSHALYSPDKKSFYRPSRYMGASLFSGYVHFPLKLLDTTKANTVLK